MDMIEQFSPGPYAELFARRARVGWGLSNRKRRSWRDCGVSCQITPGCEFPAGHEVDHPCGRPVPADGEPCQYCGDPEPCARCWQPITVADFKAICAEAGRSVEHP